jgi:hypothetical protein
MRATQPPTLLDYIEYPDEPRFQLEHKQQYLVLSAIKVRLQGKPFDLIEWSEKDDV